MIKSAETLSSPRVLYDYLAKFGVGTASGLDLPGESSGRLPAPEEWSGTTFPTLAFGQGMSVNTVQLAQVFATIANDGVRVTPSMVAGTVASDGDFTPAKPARSQRVVSAETAAAVRAMLEGVVSEEGTAPMAQIPGYRVAGKTGTAQRVDPDCGCYRGYTASFAGLAPADDPRLVVAVVLQDPRRGHYGGRLAGPVFRDVMSFALKTRMIPPSTGQPPVVQVYGR
jgi:cell division protein FtsI (penicillin-binding protein 3)